MTTKPKVGDFVQDKNGNRFEVTDVTIWNLGISCGGDYAFEENFIKVKNILGEISWFNIKDMDKEGIK